MPIRRRLGLWYGALAAVCCLLVAVSLYAIHARAHYDDLDRVLNGAAQHVAEEYAATSPSRDIAQLLTVSTAPEVSLRAYGSGGELLAQSPRSLVPPADPRAIIAQPTDHPFGLVVRLAPSLIAEAPGQGAFGLTTDADGNRWRLYVLPVDGATRFLLASAPLQRIDSSVYRFRLLAALLMAISAGGSVVAATLLAGRALRPVATLTDTASTIARSRDFHRRVPLDARNDELGRLAATFNEMLASLEQAYEAQQRFVSDASHELRAPLTVIQANLELIERRPEMTMAERHQAVDEAGREARRLAVLVADLLTLARADAGVPLRRRRVELDRVLMDVFGEARHLSRGQHLEVERLEPVMVDGDPDRLKQLLLILVDNALKYTPPEGRVAVGLRRDGRTAEVTVRDTGASITPEELPRVFERFYRADAGRARDPGGTGLGLPIARWITEQHGGDVVLTSQPGHGTTATVRLPVAG